MNLVAIAQFFHVTYIGIFKYLLVAESIENELVKLISTYYRMVERNSQGILYLYCLM